MPVVSKVRVQVDPFWTAAPTTVSPEVCRPETPLLSAYKVTLATVPPADSATLAAERVTLVPAVTGVGLMVKEPMVGATADGRRLLVMHGHEFDAVTTHAKWLAHLGDKGYGFLLWANRPLNLVRSRLGGGSLGLPVSSEIQLRWVYSTGGSSSIAGALQEGAPVEASRGNGT